MLPRQSDAAEHLRALLGDADRAVAYVGLRDADEQICVFGIVRHRVYGGIGRALATFNQQRDVGDSVLQGLEATDRASERVSVDRTLFKGLQRNKIITACQASPALPKPRAAFPQTKRKP